MRAAATLLETLLQNQIGTIFGLPGSTEAPLLDALLDYPQVRYVLALHESIVVGMADGWARATGRPGICNLHTTVGTANGLTGLYNAWRDGSPVVAIATHKHSRILGRDGFCVGPDLPEWARPVTKWAWQGIHGDQVSEEINRALKVAAAVPQSPVYLSYPEDVLAEEVPVAAPLASTTSLAEAYAPDGAEVNRVAELLRGARAPVIVAGDEVYRTGAAQAVLRLAERLRAPLLQESRRSSVFWNVDTTTPAYAGEYSSRHPLVRQADVILALGCRLSMEFYPAKAPDVPPGARLIHVHRDAWEIGKLYRAEIGLVADVRRLAEALLDHLEGYVPPAGRPWPDRAEPPARPQDAAAEPISPAGLAAILGAVAPPDTVVVDEAIRSSPALLTYYPMRPGTYFHSSGGGLGWGLPAALGIQMAWPGRPVAAVVGDGSLLFAIQALWTAVREGLPVKVIVPNNRKYLAVKAGLVEYHGNAVARNQFPGVDLTPPNLDLVHLAQGFGVPGRVAATAETVEAALAWAFAQPGPALVDVLVRDDLGEGGALVAPAWSAIVQSQATTVR